MSQSSDPPIIVTGGSARIKLGLKHFNQAPKKDFDDPDVSIKRIVVKDGAGKELQTIYFPDGKFIVEFHSEEQP